MSLKKKLKSLISEIRDSGSKVTEDESGLPTSLPAGTRLDHVADYKSQDPRIHQELIDSIDQAYFNDDQTFDIVEYNLTKIASRLDLPSIESERSSIRTQLQAVSRRVSELVLENHPAYAAELERVMELERSLQDANDICAAGRHQLLEARQNFTATSLSLLRNHRKRQQLTALLKSLSTIKTLQRTDIRLRELLEEEDFPGAIQLCLECQKAASTYKHYHCISELNSKLQDTLEMIDESMDVALSKTCVNFDEAYYSRIQTAYRLLGKTQAAVDQLCMHYTSSVHNTAFVKVLGYVQLCSSSTDTSYQKRSYADLCKGISSEVFVPCLIDLCKALWELMKSYHRTIDWHYRHDDAVVTQAPTDAGTACADGNDEAEGSGSGLSDTAVRQSYIQQKLENGLLKIWLDIQQKVKTYLLSTDLSSFKYDSFIQVLDIVNRLMQVGEEFSGAKSESLEESIRRQSLNYFRSYHRAKLDELRMFLENEGWELCPVKPTFSILMLQEFKFMRRPEAVVNGPLRRCEDPTDSAVGFFVKYAEHGSPFDIQLDEDEGEDVMVVNGVISNERRYSRDSDSDEDVPDELRADYVDERTGDVPPPQKKSGPLVRRRSYRSGGKQAPIVTNTTLTVCRLFGNYMQMMMVLKPIAFDVVIYMTQLFDYYLYSVHSFFASDADVQVASGDSVMSVKLKATLKRIAENLISSGSDVSSQAELSNISSSSIVGVTGVDSALDDHIPHPHISPAVDLRRPDTLYGLVERVVATESLMFLTEQFRLLQQRLDDAIPAAKRAFLQQFYSQTLSTAAELRRPVYRAVALRSVNVDSCLQQMMNVKWDIKEIMSQHSGYVDSLLHELSLFDQHLDRISHRVPIPKAVSDALWEHIIRLAFSTFVEGFASAKKCTNEGRALMQLDFQQFLNKLEKLTDLRPIPGREFVEVYIKAYYLPETQLETWIYDHKEYSGRQLLALVSCLGHISKRSRQRLTTVIEDIDRLNKR